MTDHDHPDTSNGPDVEPSHPGEDTDPEVLASNPEVHPSAIDDLDEDDSSGSGHPDWGKKEPAGN